MTFFTDPHGVSIHIRVECEAVKLSDIKQCDNWNQRVPEQSEREPLLTCHYNSCLYILSRYKDSEN